MDAVWAREPSRGAPTNGLLNYPTAVPNSYHYRDFRAALRRAGIVYGVAFRRVVYSTLIRAAIRSKCVREPCRSSRLVGTRPPRVCQDHAIQTTRINSFGRVNVKADRPALVSSRTTRLIPYDRSAATNARGVSQPYPNARQLTEILGKLTLSGSSEGDSAAQRANHPRSFRDELISTSVPFHFRSAPPMSVRVSSKGFPMQPTRFRRKITR